MSPLTWLRDQWKKRFTLLELLVVVAIISILMTILLPALRNARESSKRIVCANNMRQIHLTVMGYANDNDSNMPYMANWTGVTAENMGIAGQYTLFQYASMGNPSVNIAVKDKMDGVMICPSTKHPDDAPYWSEGPYNGLPFYSSYSPTTKYTDASNYLDEKGKYGGWLCTMASSERVSKKLFQIPDNSIILAEQSYYDYGNYGGGPAYVRPMMGAPASMMYPTTPFESYSVAFRHGANTANFLFKEGNVENYKYGVQVDSDWQVQD